MSPDYSESPAYLETGVFSWRVTAPLISAAVRPADPCFSIKDPSVVMHDHRWHVFASIRSEKRTHQIEYLSFRRWEEADQAERHVLSVTDGYFGAPQVFYFEPQGLWYLLYQVIDQAREPALQPACSTSSEMADPSSWSAPSLLFRESPPNIEKWIDFWILCDEAKAHLFFTSLDGKMWHSDTPLGAFPHGWSLPRIVLQADVYEASHTYNLRGLERYLTVIEAVADGRRYFKAYTAENLDGSWQPLADSLEKPLAGVANVLDTAGHWTDSFSHGELLRSGIDQRLEIDPHSLRLLFQGVLDEDREGKIYGQIPWKLGLLEQV